MPILLVKPSIMLSIMVYHVIHQILLVYMTHDIRPVLMLSTSGARTILNHHLMFPPWAVAGKRLEITHGCVLPMRIH